MNTPHEAVTGAIVEWTQYDEGHANQAATAAIEALREGAVERLKGTFDANRWAPSDEQIVDAILGPPAASFDTSSGSVTVDLGPPERKGK